MSIEKFDPNELLPQGRITLLDRIRALLFKQKDIPVSREFYNKDRTKRYAFYEWREGDNFRQLNISLEYRIGSSWGCIMKAMTKWEDQEEQAYGLEVEGLTDRDDTCPLATYWYTYSTGGHKDFSGMWGRPLGLSDDEARQVVKQLGFLDEKDLPEYIDFEGTITQFMLQAKSLDFSTPALMPKPLIE